MKYYDADLDLGITNNPSGNLCTWGEGSRERKDELRKLGFSFRFGCWVGPRATVENFARSVDAVFGATVDTSDLRDAKRAAWA